VRRAVSGACGLRDRWQSVARDPPEPAPA
jgi:hypothetical protein